MVYHPCEGILPYDMPRTNQFLPNGKRSSKRYESGLQRLGPAREYHDRNVCRVVQTIDFSRKKERVSLIADAAYGQAATCTMLAPFGLAWMTWLGMVRKRVSAWGYYRKSGYCPQPGIRIKTDPD